MGRRGIAVVGVGAYGQTWMRKYIEGRGVYGREWEYTGGSGSNWEGVGVYGREWE